MKGKKQKQMSEVFHRDTLRLNERLVTELLKTPVPRDTYFLVSQHCPDVGQGLPQHQLHLKGPKPCTRKHEAHTDLEPQCTLCKSSLKTGPAEKG